MDMNDAFRRELLHTPVCVECGVLPGPGILGICAECAHERYLDDLEEEEAQRCPEACAAWRRDRDRDEDAAVLSATDKVTA